MKVSEKNQAPAIAAELSSQDGRWVAAQRTKFQLYLPCSSNRAGQRAEQITRFQSQVKSNLSPMEEALLK